MWHPAVSMGALSNFARRMKDQFILCRLAIRHPRTPRLSRWLMVAAVAYALSPLDLIPDWIPVVGYLDDLLVVPTLLWLGWKLVPAEVKDECRQQSLALKQRSLQSTPATVNKPGSRRLVLLVLLFLTVLVWKLLQPPGPGVRYWFHQMREYSPTPALASGPWQIAQTQKWVSGKLINRIANYPYVVLPGQANPAQTMDIYAPAGGHDLPVLVYVHGGGWISGDKCGGETKGWYFASQGVVVASINYRLIPCIRRPDAVMDIAFALAHLHQGVASVGGDPRRIFLMGHSAGAHLAALAVCDPQYLGKYQLESTTVRGMILLDGSAYDVPLMMQTQRGEDFSFVFGTIPSLWPGLSPADQARGRKGLPPSLLYHAGGDELRKLGAESLALELRNGGTFVQVIPMPQRDHGSIDAMVGQDGETITRQVLKFIAGDGFFEPQALEP